MGTRFVTSLVTRLIAAGLIAFSLRRLLFSVAAIAGALAEKPRNSGQDAFPTVTLLLAARDEESSIGQTLEAVSQLDYPPERLEVVMIDDGSRDRTPEVMATFARANPHFRYHRVAGETSLGKAAALSQALHTYPEKEIIYVLDADSVPEPSCVRAGVQHFADDRVGAVTGAPYPSESCSSVASYYAYLEQIVHQSVTIRAKDVLGLAPGIFGSNCAYRRSALENIGGFREGALLEDSDLVLAMYAAGYTVKFEPKARSRLAMPKTLSSYFRQHARWTRGFNDVLGSRGLTILSRRQLPLAIRIELFLFASGYLDRILMMLGAALVVVDALHQKAFGFPRWILAASFLSPLSTIVSALAICREPLSRHWRLPFVPFFFGLDMISTAKGTMDSLTNKPRAWHRVEREV